MVLFVTTTSIVTLLFVALAVILVARLAFSTGGRVSKPYAKKVLEQVSEGAEVVSESIKIEKLKMPELLAESKEKEFYEVEAITADNESVGMFVQAFYPYAELDESHLEEQQKENRPSENTALKGAGSQGGMEGVQNMMAQQRKIEEEGKVVEAKINQHSKSVEMLKRIGEVSGLVPRLYHYDKRKLLTFFEYIGTDTLKKVILNASWGHKKALLENVAHELAVLHSKGSGLLLGLPIPHVKDRKLGAIGESLSSLKSVGFLSEANETKEMSEIYRAVAEFIEREAESGLKLSNCSPYNLYVHDGSVHLLEWEGTRRDFVALDLAELLRDPVCNLTWEQEEALVREYVEVRANLSETFDSNEFLKEYYMVANDFSLGQARYVAQYIVGVRERVSEGKMVDIVIPHWDEEGLALLLDKCVRSWALYEESSEFAAKLQISGK